MTEETRSGEFRLVLGGDDSIDCFDLTTQTPCVVNSEPKKYEDDDIRQTLRTLKPGNRVKATLESTGEIRDTGLFESKLYQFTELEIIDKTRTYAGFGDIPVVGSAESIIDKLVSSGKGIGRADITGFDGSTIGRVVVFNRDHPSPAEPVFEEELQSLNELSDPPFVVFQTASDDARFFVHYYLINEDVKLAKAFKAALKSE